MSIIYMRYTRSEDSQSFNCKRSQSDAGKGPHKRLKRIVLVRDEGEQLMINRKRDRFRQWIKVMQWAIIAYVPEEQLNRPTSKLYFRRTRFEKNRIMNLATTTVDTEFEPYSINTISIELSEGEQPKGLNQYEDNYLRTLLDEKCLMYPPQKLKRNV